MKSYIFGHTRQQLPLIAYEFGNSVPKVLILGGVHGDEWEGVVAAKALLSCFAQGSLPRLQITLIPIFNVDGVLTCQRKNSARVDLNRNLPTQDWTDKAANDRYNPGSSANSEPENQALTKWLEDNRPQLVLSLHSWKPLLNTNGNCTEVAQAIAQYTGYEVKDDIGYPTPGSLGTYCGLERDMPTLTYELERDLHPDKIIATHVPAILEALKVIESSRSVTN